MKGVVLAGGTGSRLDPLTEVTNKHLLPVYDKPMIFYPIQTLVNAGILDVIVVTTHKHADDFSRVLGDGRNLGLRRLEFACQESENGVAGALGLAESFVAGDRVCVVLGDNIMESNVCAAVQKFEAQATGAKVILKQVQDPARFGVPEFRNGRIVSIAEKPAVPASDCAVIGLYMYDATVFDKIRSISPSLRGELEISDVNNLYIAENTLTFEFLDGWWTDAGTFDSLLRASTLVARTGANKLPATAKQRGN